MDNRAVSFSCKCSSYMAISSYISNEALLREATLGSPLCVAGAPSSRSGARCRPAFLGLAEENRVSCQCLSQTSALLVLEFSSTLPWPWGILFHAGQHGAAGCPARSLPPGRARPVPWAVPCVVSHRCQGWSSHPVELLWQCVTQH